MLRIPSSPPQSRKINERNVCYVRVRICCISFDKVRELRLLETEKRRACYFVMFGGKKEEKK